MPNKLYLECYSGISGDMTVAALLDLGADQQVLLEGLESLNLSGYQLKIGRVKKNGIDACDFDVILDEPEHHHDHDHEHHHDHDHDHEHHHDHEHEHPHDHEHEHHHEHDENCTCGCHDHDHHHHHHADEIFTSWGFETPATYTTEEVEGFLKELDNEEKYGIVLRAKGMIPAADGTWIYFDYVPEESNVRAGKPDVTGKICVIGSKLKEAELENLFRK